MRIHRIGAASAWLLAVCSVAACQPMTDLETLLKGRFPSLIAYTEGRFTPTTSLQYAVFHEDQRGAPGIERAVLATVVSVHDGTIVGAIDLGAPPIRMWTLRYQQRQLDVISGFSSSLGRWNGYSYVGDFNGNGIDEIYAFRLAGDSFLPVVVESIGEQFRRVLEFDTYYAQLSEIRVETWAGQRTLRLFGYGSPDLPEGKRDWYRYAWDTQGKTYRIVEQGME